LEDYFLNYEYYLAISDYTSDALVGVAELTTRPKDGYEYSLSLCRFLELPNGTAIHLPIDEDDHDLFEETLEDLGDLRIAEKREDYSFFKGSLDSLEYVEVLEDIFDI